MQYIKSAKHLYFTRKCSSLLITKIEILCLYITVSGVDQRRQVKQTWCSRPLPNQTGKCIIEEYESKCRQKWKGNRTEATCRHQCTCHFRCPWLQGQA
ncbi:hypothetical protein ARALYDRAFT_911364 [Arabidopsis lyrata subsp. lyrata]|uniref:Uncharacterized protein n=1 Tax=Arabidopsis lyrata subsp. lyrata TaxID=81972 RepID=D7LYQ5_ARALL|nr:hypothetical protein ARALYDRAFT_911364 [Arabidopsis lyrata subsp. lyrata]